MVESSRTMQNLGLSTICQGPQKNKQASIMKNCTKFDFNSLSIRTKIYNSLASNHRTDNSKPISDMIVC